MPSSLMNLVVLQCCTWKILQWRPGKTRGGGGGGYKKYGKGILQILTYSLPISSPLAPLNTLLAKFLAAMLCQSCMVMALYVFSSPLHFLV